MYAHVKDGIGISSPSLQARFRRPVACNGLPVPWAGYIELVTLNCTHGKLLEIDIVLGARFCPTPTRKSRMEGVILGVVSETDTTPTCLKPCLSEVGVFDGHGPFGHHVANFVQENLPRHLLLSEPGSK